MSKLTVVAKLMAKKESVEAVKAELLKLIAPTRKEEGYIEYRLHQDKADPAVFIFYENWESDACLEKHKETDHYRSCFSAVADMIQDRSVNKLTIIEP